MSILSDAWWAAQERAISLSVHRPESFVKIDITHNHNHQRINPEMSQPYDGSNRFEVKWLPERINGKTYMTALGEDGKVVHRLRIELFEEHPAGGEAIATASSWPLIDRMIRALSNDVQREVTRAEAAEAATKPATPPVRPEGAKVPRRMRRPAPKPSEPVQEPSSPGLRASGTWVTDDVWHRKGTPSVTEINWMRSHAEKIVLQVNAGWGSVNRQLHDSQIADLFKLLKPLAEEHGAWVSVTIQTILKWYDLSSAQRDNLHRVLVAGLRSSNGEVMRTPKGLTVFIHLDPVAQQVHKSITMKTAILPNMTMRELDPRKDPDPLVDSSGVEAIQEMRTTLNDSLVRAAEVIKASDIPRTVTQSAEKAFPHYVMNIDGTMEQFSVTDQGVSIDQESASALRRAWERTLRGRWSG